MVVGSPTKLNLIPSGVMPVVYINQGDAGYDKEFLIYNGDSPYNVPEFVTATIRGTKADGYGVTEAAAVTEGSNLVTVTITEQMVAAEGKNLYELVFVDTDGLRVASINMTWAVKKDALGDSVISDSDLDYATTVMNTLQSVAAFKNQLDTNTSGLAAETAARIAADETERTARIAADNNLQVNINNEASARIAEDASLQSQIDQIIAPSGSAPSAAEVENARIGANGVTYNTLGNAIRGQVTELDKNIDDVSDAFDKINYLSTEPVEGYYIPYTGSGIGANAEWSYYPLFEIEGGFYYAASFNGAHVAFYDSARNYISGVLVNNGPTNFDFLAPDNAVYATYSYKTASGDQYFMRSSNNELKYYDYNKKKLSRDISLLLEHFDPIVKFGKNLFNKHNLITGYCMDYAVGARIWRNANYCFCPDYIPAKPSTPYYFNALCVITEYDENYNCVATHNKTGTASGTITTTATTAFLRIGTQISRAEILQVEEGTAATEYEPFGFTMPMNLDNIASGEGSIKTVKTDGTGDYSTISSAIADANTDDIILIYPGTYNESVHAYNKRVHLIGTNRALCVLTYSGLDYANPPLEMAKGSVSNLTIKATNSGAVGANKAYCVHIDNDNEAGEALSFNNVDFINEVHQALGIGLRANFTLTFDTCRMTAEDQAALYCHTWETSDTSADKTGQKLIVRNCSIVNNSSNRTPILLQSQELIDKGAEAVFIGNSVLNKAGGNAISMVLWAGRTLTNTNFMGSSDWVLSDDSALNSSDMINSSGSINAYTSPGILYNRVKDVTGGYIKIGRVVYVNIKFTANATANNTPNILSGFPRPLGDTAVLSGFRADNWSTSGINNAVMIGIINNNAQIAAMTSGQTFYVTGTYISAT